MAMTMLQSPVLQCVAVCCSVLHSPARACVRSLALSLEKPRTQLLHLARSCEIHVAIARVAVCCSVLQCVAVCCSELHSPAREKQLLHLARSCEIHAQMHLYLHIYLVYICIHTQEYMTYL